MLATMDTILLVPSKVVACIDEKVLDANHEIKNNKCTLVKIYISFKILVERLKRGFPLKPPVSKDNGFSSAGCGLEIVVFDII